MPSGIEVAGIALAMIPIVVHQIDTYVLGIERIKILRRYKREFKGYSTGLKTQRVILLNTLEQALEGVVEDDDQVSELIRDPNGPGWKSDELKRQLRRKMGRNYEVFLENIADLLELIEVLSRKLRIDPTNTNTNQETSSKGWDLRKFRKVINKAIYDDLLQKLNAANSILKTLIDYSTHREEVRTRRQPWSYLLKRFKRARGHAEELLHTIVGENSWRCRCKDQPCVNLKLEANPLHGAKDHEEKEYNDDHLFRVVFSNSNKSSKNCVWGWTEVLFEAYPTEDTLTLSGLSLCNDPIPVEESHNRRKKPRVQFEIPRDEQKPIPEKFESALSSTPIQDICSALGPAAPANGPTGYIANELGSMKFMMHKVKVFTATSHIRHEPLGKVLYNISGIWRLYIAARLACSVVQFHENWLKPNWDNSDILLATRPSTDGCNALILDNIYLSWPLSTTHTMGGLGNQMQDPDLVISGSNRLLSLGIILVELSLGQPLCEVLRSGDEEEPDISVTKRATASQLVEKVWPKSGIEYADAVNACFSWSGLHQEKNFEDYVFNMIVCPLLKNLAFQEGL